MSGIRSRRGSGFDGLLAAARAGSTEAIGRLLMEARSYLLLVASREMPVDLRRKITPSDVVQDTYLEAQRHFPQFSGSTPDDLLAWLRRILLNNLTDALRFYRQASCRRIDREVSLDATDSQPAAQAAEVRRATGRNALDELIRGEEAVMVAAAVDRLPELHRAVLRMRYWEGLTCIAIGVRLERSADAVRKTWHRAIVHLARELSLAGRDGRQPHGTVTGGPPQTIRARDEMAG